jgi:enoyl-CoA hydratase
MENLIIEDKGHIRLITINRPSKLNALNSELIRELSEAMKAADQDRNVRVLILTGTGEKAFGAGADISEFANYDAIRGEELSARGHKLLFTAIEKMGTPVIAAVNGFALGGGLELAMSCHIRVGSSNARLGLPEVSLGVIPGYGGTQRLAQLVGKGKALEIMLSADMIAADEALRIGLLNHVVAPEELMDKCMEIANRISRNSPKAIAAAIRSLNAMYTEGVDGFAVEIQAFGSCFETEDFKEGTQAFLEKRKPQFTGK